MGIDTPTPRTAFEVNGTSGSSIRITGGTGGVGTQVALDLNTFDAFQYNGQTNPTARLLATDDGQYTCDVDVQTRVPNNNTATNRLVTWIHVGTVGGYIGLATNVYVTNNLFVKGLQVTSDRNAKENFAPLAGNNILDKVAALPITEWNYKGDSAEEKHIGPMAQDFHAAFGLDGADDRHISMTDESGVALAAIQALNQKLNAANGDLKGQLAAQAAQLQARDAQIAALEERLERLERRLPVDSR